jgi:hypothetical protein
MEQRDDARPEQPEERPPWPPGGFEHDPPVTVRTFTRVDERMPLDAFLRAEGVPTHMPDGNTLSIQPDLYIALGFFKLQVPRSLRGRAELLLGEWDRATPLPSDLEFVPSGEQVEPEPERARFASTMGWAMAAVVVALIAMSVASQVFGWQGF